jgi:phosphoenolpyruvate-protein kinase (PTS system EI component)
VRAGRRLTGVAASEGVAVGPAFVHASKELKPERQNISEIQVEEELERFQSAVEAVAKKLSATAKEMREGGSEKEAGIFEAHLEMAEDPEFHSEVEERVKGLESPEGAVISVGEEFATLFDGMEDEYMAARADDVRDVASQIAAELMGNETAGLKALAEPSVILALNLAPSDTARIPKGMALGFVISEGSRTSHVSIMARSFGIPAVVGVGAELKYALEARMVALDGTEGYAVADPDEHLISDFEQKQKDAAAEAALLEEYIHTEARTKDGCRIEVAANIDRLGRGG